MLVRAHIYDKIDLAKIAHILQQHGIIINNISIKEEASYHEEYYMPFSFNVLNDENYYTISNKNNKQPISLKKEITNEEIKRRRELL